MSYICTGLFVVMLASIFMYGIHSFQLKSVQKQNEIINNQIIEYAQYKNLNDKVNAIKNKVSVIETLDPHVLDIIALISACMPEGTWLESVNINEGSFTVVGCANAYGDAAKTLQAFQSRSEFSNVVCENTTETGSAGKFTISAIIN